MPTKQTLLNRKTSVVSLQALADPCDRQLTVTYEDTAFHHWSHFVVRDRDGTIVFQGRYQQVYAWLDGVRFALAKP